MARTRRISGILATIALLVAYGSAASLTARQEPSQQAACAYAPVSIDTSSLPQPVKYPPDPPIEPPAPRGSEPPTYGLEELQDPPVAQEDAITVEEGKHVRNYKPLEIQYSDPDEKRIAGCGVRLRTYNGELVGPTLRAKPGQTLKFTVKNNLPETSSPSPHWTESTNGNWSMKRRVHTSFISMSTRSRQ